MPVSPSDADGARARVLLVDNDSDLSELYTDLLVQAGWTVHAAHNGLEGWNELCRLDAAGGAPDVVLLDLRMPGMDGFAFLDRLAARAPRASPAHARPAVVVCSGFVSDDDRRRLEACPFVRAVLKKPFDVFELERVLRGAVREAPPDAEGAEG